LGTSSYWLTDAEDITQYIAGFNYYFISEWHFPLLAFDSLNYPGGTRATFVDAIPLYALILKLILPHSLYPFNPFGYWVAFCFVMQGIGSWLIAKELRINCIFTTITLAAILSAFPALLFRLGHISLMSHWIILFSLALYFEAKRISKLQIIKISILLFVSFYINIYLFVMASAIYFASALLIIRNDFSLKKIGAALLPFVLVLTSTLLFLFPLPPGGGTGDSGFGFYSMNLLSPFYGGTIFDLQLPMMFGQKYEGFNYLGLGTIIALSITLFVNKNIHKSIKSNFSLFVVLCILFLYSLSGDIYFSNALVAKLYYPHVTDTLTAQFRASGRFFWPVGYVLSIYGIYKIYKLPSFKTRYILLLIVFSIQYVDLVNQFSLFKERSSRQALEQINYKVWEEDIKNNDIKNIYFYPKFRCGGDPMKTLLPIMNLSSKLNINLNTGYIARYMPSCDDYAKEIKKSPKSGSLYIFDSNSYTESDVGRFLINKENFSCLRRDFAYVCRYKQGAY